MTLKSDFIKCPSSKGTITFAFNPYFEKGTKTSKILETKFSEIA